MGSLKTRSDFDRVYKKGKKVNGSFLRFYYLKLGDTSEETRIGISTNKKIGNAVLRNKIRRILREYTRTLLVNGKNRFDILFIANTNIYKDNLKDFKEELKKLLNRFLVSE